MKLENLQISMSSTSTATASTEVFRQNIKNGGPSSNADKNPGGVVEFFKDRADNGDIAKEITGQKNVSSSGNDEGSDNYEGGNNYIMKEITRKQTEHMKYILNNYCPGEDDNGQPKYSGDNAFYTREIIEHMRGQYDGDNSYVEGDNNGVRVVPNGDNYFQREVDDGDNGKGIGGADTNYYAKYMDNLKNQNPEGGNNDYLRYNGDDNFYQPRVVEEEINKDLDENYYNEGKLTFFLFFLSN